MNKTFKFLKRTLVSGLIFSFVFISLPFANNVHALTKCMKITIVGDYESGKTNIRNRMTGYRFVATRNHTQTSDSIYEVIRYDQNTSILCKIWDAAGEAKVKKQILNDRILGSHFVIVTFDMTGTLNPKYDNLVEQAVIEWCNKIREKSPQSHIILVGTKADMVNSQAEVNKIRAKLEQMTQVFSRLSVAITSSYNGNGINALTDIIKNNTNVANLPTCDNKFVAKGESDDASRTCTIL